MIRQAQWHHWLAGLVDGGWSVVILYWLTHTEGPLQFVAVWIVGFVIGRLIGGWFALTKPMEVLPKWFTYPIAGFQFALWGYTVVCVVVWAFHQLPA